MLLAFRGGDLLWRCPHCNRENTAHGSHEQVGHASYLEQETVLEGTFTDERGRVWTRQSTRPVETRCFDETTVDVPVCACGSHTSLSVNRDPAYHATISLVDADGNPTTNSIEALHRHLELADFLRKIGKGPDDVRRST